MNGYVFVHAHLNKISYVHETQVCDSQLTNPLTCESRNHNNKLHNRLLFKNKLIFQGLHCSWITDSIQDAGKTFSWQQNRCILAASDLNYPKMKASAQSATNLASDWTYRNQLPKEKFKDCFCCARNGSHQKTKYSGKGTKGADEEYLILGNVKSHH